MLPNLHNDERINLHVETVACQTCHIPATSTKDPTKVYWDWLNRRSRAARGSLHHLKIRKGSFVYEKDYQPTYTWFNGNADYRYLLGDTIDPSQTTVLNPPAGTITDPTASIFPSRSTPHANPMTASTITCCSR